MAQKVRIRWRSNHSEYQHPSEYQFDTLAEMKAFLLGIEEAEGWMQTERIDPLPDGTWPPICEQCGSADLTIESDGYQCHGCDEEFSGAPTPMEEG